MNTQKKVIQLQEATTKQVAIKDLFPDSKSYGGNSLATNIENAELAIANVQYTERIWDRSRSQWMLKHLTCSQADGWLRLRQIGAEMSRKRMALNEAKFGYLKKKMKIGVKREEMDKASPANYRLLEVEIMELESQMQEVMVKVEGALKEVQTLSGMHDSLKEHLGEISEEEFEKAQTKGHIKRAMQQSIREVRECGRIKTGNQEYLEQSGVCVTHAFGLITDYLEQEKTATNTTLLHSFLDAVAEELEPVADLQLEIFGFDKDTDLSLTYKPEIDTE
jgi:regulator of replication initiation timing